MDCTVCFEPFDAQNRRPKCLPCGHTYCLQCLQNPDFGRQCPVDRKPFENPSNLTDNYQVFNFDTDSQTVRNGYWCRGCNAEAQDICIEEGHTLCSLQKRNTEQAEAQLQQLQHSVKAGRKHAKQLQKQVRKARKQREELNSQLQKQVREAQKREEELNSELQEAYQLEHVLQETEVKLKQRNEDIDLLRFQHWIDEENWAKKNQELLGEIAEITEDKEYWHQEFIIFRRKVDWQDQKIQGLRMELELTRNRHLNEVDALKFKVNRLSLACVILFGFWAYCLC